MLELIGLSYIGIKLPWIFMTDLVLSSRMNGGDIACVEKNYWSLAAANHSETA